MTVTADHNLHQLTGQSAGGKMVFRGSLSKPSQVTVGGNPATSGYYSTNFTGFASVTQGTNNVPIIAADVNGNVSTNKYQVVIPPTSGSYTYDLNGNLTNDGSKTYSYDAKNELVKITYADTSYTAFTYNGSGARVEIQEYNSSHTLTSTKWFVGNEERDGSNVTTRRYFSQGEQRISGGTSTNYFYTRDHLGSIREVMAVDGTTIAARYSYDPFGRRTKVSGSIDCDFGFTGYYHHAASGLDLSATRPYDSNTGRFIQRDPSGEGSGLNLYAYCGGDPINLTDPSGLAPNTFIDPNVLNNPFNDPATLSIIAPSPLGPRRCMDGPPLDPNLSNFDNKSYPTAKAVEAAEDAHDKMVDEAMEQGLHSGTVLDLFSPLLGPARVVGIGAIAAKTVAKEVPNATKILPQLYDPDQLIPIIKDGKVIGHIAYKDIPYGSLISPKGYLINAQAKGGAIGDIMNLDVQ